MDLFLGIFKNPLSEYDTVICHVCHVRDGFFATIRYKNCALV